jgi:AraC-like DNA-binding protein
LPIIQLSRAVGINQNKLKTGFKRLYQNTIYGALFEYKMKQASEMLKTRQWSISEIAEKIGYSHPGHFINAFKKKYGITPHRFRNLVILLVVMISAV